MIRFADGTELNSVSIFGGTTNFGLERRAYLDITVSDCTYETVNGLFVDGAQFSVVDEDGVYDKFEYQVAGPITDLRNGTFQVRMSAKNERELEMEQLEKENAVLLYEVVTGGEWVE